MRTVSGKYVIFWHAISQWKYDSCWRCVQEICGCSETIAQLRSPRLSGGVTVCLSVRSSVPCLNITREREGIRSPNMAGRKPILRVPMNLFRGQKVKGQRSRSPGRLMLRPEVRNIFRTGRPTNFKLGAHTEHARPASVNKRRDLQGQRSRSQGHVMRLTGVGR